MSLDVAAMLRSLPDWATGTNITALTAVIGGMIAFFNYRRSVAWKKAELASSYVKELNSNQELVFACRALDWYAGLLVLPESFQPLWNGKPEKAIPHDPAVLHVAMILNLSTSAMEVERRHQIYRTALDSLLMWLSSVDQALGRRLFRAKDIRIAAYWFWKIETAPWMDEFIEHYYPQERRRLRKKFKRMRHPSIAPPLVQKYRAELG